MSCMGGFLLQMALVLLSSSPPTLVFSSTILIFLPDLSSILSGDLDGRQNCVWCGISEFPSFGDLLCRRPLAGFFWVSYIVCSSVF